MVKVRFCPIKMAVYALSLSLLSSDLETRDRHVGAALMDDVLVKICDCSPGCAWYRSDGCVVQGLCDIGGDIAAAISR